MALLTAKTPRAIAPHQQQLHQQYQKQGQLIRYALDKPALLHWFGGELRLKELCEVFGVPPLYMVKTGVPITLANVLTMLELAERMGKPLDLYQFLREVR